MTMTIQRTTLCICLHIQSMHDDSEACTLCGCEKFQVGSRNSSHHYRRGQGTDRKRVARLVAGDRVLVGFPGHDEYVRGHLGGIVWVQEAGTVTSRPLVTHVDDGQLRPVEYKTGALVATVLDARRINGAWVVDTDLGDMPALPGHRAVHVLTGAQSWSV